MAIPDVLLWKETSTNRRAER